MLTLSAVCALGLAGCGVSAGSSDSEEVDANFTVQVETAAAEADKPADSSFENGVLTTAELEVEIVDYKVIPAGQVGNEYGDDTVLAIWYDTTNLGTSDEDISPITAFISNFEAVQDNNPNAENTLNIGMLPDKEFLDSQTRGIKPGGTVTNAFAYTLTDTTTPVELIAGRFGPEVGRMTFSLN